MTLVRWVAIAFFAVFLLSTAYGVGKRPSQPVQKLDKTPGEFCMSCPSSTLSDDPCCPHSKADRQYVKRVYRHLMSAEIRLNDMNRFAQATGPEAVYMMRAEMDLSLASDGYYSFIQGLTKRADLERLMKQLDRDMEDYPPTDIHVEHMRIDPNIPNDGFITCPTTKETQVGGHCN
jgi:hypothetical protein